MIIPKLIQKSIFSTHHLLNKLQRAHYSLWIPWAGFLCSLLIVPNNKIMSVVLLITLLFTMHRIKNITVSFYYVLVLCLAFTKGKGFQFMLLFPHETGSNIPYTFDFDITFWNMLLLLLVYFVVRYRNSFKKRTLRWRDIVFILFVLSLIPSIGFSQYPNIATLGFIEVLFLVLLYFVTKLLREHIRLKALSLIISLQLIFEGVMSVLQFVLKRPLGIAIENAGGLLIQSNFIEYAFEQIGFFRSRGTFDHSNSLGSFAVSLLPFLSILLLYKKTDAIEKKLYSLGLILGTAAVIVSGSRTSIFIMLLFFALLLFFGKKHIVPLLHLKRTGRAIIIGLFLTSLPLIIFPRMLQLFVTLKEGGGLTYRMDLLHYAMQMVQNNMFGVGLGLFPKILFDDIGTFTSYPTQPHNLFAQIGAEGGTLALILFCIFFFTSLFIIIKKAIISSRRKIITSDGAYTIAFAASLIVMLILSTVYPFLLRSYVFPYFLVFLAMAD